MTTFTISSDTNIDACAGGTGGHVYNLSNAAVLTIDQDSRAGLNGTTSNSIERIVTASTGGTTRFDGRYVRLIPFTNGSGTITAGATVDCGSATGKVIAVYTSLTDAPALTGASGWIKIKAWNSVAYPTSGTFTKGGFTFDITGPDIVGWIEVLAVEGTTAEPGLAYTGAYIGGFEMLGEWFELGTTSGTSNQTFQIPTNGQACYIPGVFIEETVGAGDFEFYANVADATDIATDMRGKVCWIPSTGLVRLGNNGTTTAGYTPGAGRRVVIGNIITSHCTAAARTANVIPNATLANRFQIGATYATVPVRYLINKSNLTWYLVAENAASVVLTNSTYSDSFTLVNSLSPFQLVNVGCGISQNANYQAISIEGCVVGGTVTRARMWSAQATADSKRMASAVNSSAVGLTDTVFAFARNVAANYVISLRVSNCTNLHGDGVWCIGGCVRAEYSLNTKIDNLRYCSCVSGSTVSTYVQQSVVAYGSKATIVNGVDFTDAINVHPYTCIFSVESGSSDSVLSNIGEYAAPLSLGSANQSGYLMIAGGARSACSGAKVVNCYVTNSRSGFMSDRIEMFRTNVWSSGDDYGQSARPQCNESDWRGVKCAGTLGTADSYFGLHFWDAFTSETAGRLILLAHPASAASAPYVTFTTSTTAYFNGANGLILKAVDDTCTWEDKVYRIGHTGFSGAPVMAGGTASNYRIEYDIDLNDGVGWRGFETASAVNLEARNASIDAARGFKIKVRITTTNANTSAITSLYFATTSTTTTQAYQYKMHETPVTFHAIDATTLGNVAGAWVYVDAGAGGEYVAGTEIGRGQTDANGLCTIVVKHDAAQIISGVVRKSSATPFYNQGVLQASVTPGEAQTIVTALTRED